MRQATLVACYGPKRDPLRDLLRSWQDRLARSIRQIGAEAAFDPYPLAQIHATVLGLERLPRPGLYNRNLHDFGGNSERHDVQGFEPLRAMRLPDLFAFLLDSGHFPLDVQFGGFENREYPFRSRAARPYHRSFSIQGRTAVAIGWPAPTARDGHTTTRDWPLTLDELRRSAQRFNVLHRWHREPFDVDNDLYLRLGVIDGELTEPQRQLVEQQMRRAMSESPPSAVRISASELAVVSYPAGEEILPVDRCEVVRLTDPRLRSEEFIAELYA